MEREIGYLIQWTEARGLGKQTLLGLGCSDIVWIEDIGYSPWDARTCVLTFTVEKLHNCIIVLD
jgi:hypothetical protein